MHPNLYERDMAWPFFFLQYLTLAFAARDRVHIGTVTNFFVDMFKGCLNLALYWSGMLYNTTKVGFSWRGF